MPEEWTQHRRDEARPSPPHRPRLALEFGILFLIGPFAYRQLAANQGWLFPALWAWGLTCLVLLLRDHGFDRRQFWNVSGAWKELRPMVVRFAILGGFIIAAVALLTPDRLWGLPRHNPRLWLAIMLGYPLASVYPQEVIFRAFFFRRYAPLFGPTAAVIAASAVAFGYLHIIFGNGIAIAMTLVGGVLFATTYARSRSLLAASLEHSLYGCLVFTAGLGSYFYDGAM